MEARKKNYNKFIVEPREPGYMVVEDGIPGERLIVAVVDSPRIDNETRKKVAEAIAKTANAFFAKTRLDCVIEKLSDGADVLDAFEDEKLGRIHFYQHTFAHPNRYKTIERDGHRLILLPDGEAWKIVGIEKLVGE